MRHIAPTVPATCCLLLPCLVAACGETTRDEPRPNVLLISIDSLRADHLGCYGYERATSPRIDALAQDGMLFEQAFSSSSWTLPAHGALFTGLPDSAHGCFLPTLALADERTTLAEALRDAGYSTAGFWSGPFLDPRYGFAQGFDEYVDCTGYGAAQADGNVHGWSHADVTGPRVVQAFERWFDERPERPFFAFVHLWDPHYDFIPPPPYDSMFGEGGESTVDGRGLGALATLSNKRRPGDAELERLVALYDGEIAWTDHHVGRIIDFLDERGLLDDTIVVVASDHGEEFFEHGKFGHRKELFEESVRVALVMRFPRALPAGKRVRAPVGLVDVAPTLLQLTGTLALPDTLGRPLESGAGHSVAVSELEHPVRGDSHLAIRGPDWKLVIHEERDGQTTSWFDLFADPGELLPLAADSMPDEARVAMRQTLDTLERLRARHAGGDDDASRPIPLGLERQLEALGYVESKGGE